MVCQRGEPTTDIGRALDWLLDDDRPRVWSRRQLLRRRLGCLCPVCKSWLLEYGQPPSETNEPIRRQSEPADDTDAEREQAALDAYL